MARARTPITRRGRALDRRLHFRHPDKGAARTRRHTRQIREHEGNTMRNSHHWHLAAALTGAVAFGGTMAAAQSPAPQPGSQPAADTAAPQAAGQVTATGCLQRASATTGTTTSNTNTPSASAAGSEGGFVLKQARVGGAAGAGSSDASARPQAGSPASSNESTDSKPTGGAQAGNTSASPSTAGRTPVGAGRDIHLRADASVNLAEHVGHQVMVTGRMGASAGPAHRGMTHDSSMVVSKVSMMSSTCTSGS
jgi:hypothetical protein